MPFPGLGHHTQNKIRFLTMAHHGLASTQLSGPILPYTAPHPWATATLASLPSLPHSTHQMRAELHSYCSGLAPLLWLQGAVTPCHRISSSVHLYLEVSIQHLCEQCVRMFHPWKSDPRNSAPFPSLPVEFLPPSPFCPRLPREQWSPLRSLT